LPSGTADVAFANWATPTGTADVAIADWALLLFGVESWSVGMSEMAAR
jgi:hypothetical protein